MTALYAGQGTPGYNLDWGCYWNLCHNDGTNGGIRKEMIRRWVARVIGEPLPVEPNMWRGHITFSPDSKRKRSPKPRRSDHGTD